MDDYTLHFDQQPSKGPLRLTWKGQQPTVQLDVLGLGTLFIRTSVSYDGKEIPEGIRFLTFTGGKV